MTDPRDRPAETEVEVTQDMVRVASEVEWVSDFRFEFGIEDDDEMARKLKELLTALGFVQLHG